MVTYLLWLQIQTKKQFSQLLALLQIKVRLITQLPRIVIDAKGQDKGQQAGDAKFEVHIDKKPVEYKEIANSKDARIMQIDVSKNDRTIEIIGTRMAGQ